MIKGYASVEIPTKAYVQAWVMKELGEPAIISERHHIGSKLIDLLEHKRNYRANDYRPQSYQAMLKVYLRQHTYKVYGCNLNETNVIRFNAYLEEYLKSMMRWKLDIFFKLTESMEASIDLLREDIGLDERIFTSDMIKQDYYRYRRERGIIYPKGGYKKRQAVNIQAIL